MRNYIRDGGGPSGTALQEEVSNYPELLLPKVKVVSVREKASCKMSGKDQEDEANEPLRKCRKRIDEIKTEG